MEETLAFESSNELLNRLVEATRWSAKNNHVDVPTDCPTRERHGWTGDAQIFCNTAAYLFNYAPFARKYVFDMVDGQRKNGKFRQITPKGGIDFYMNFMDGSAAILKSARKLPKSKSISFFWDPLQAQLPGGLILQNACAYKRKSAISRYVGDCGAEKYV